MEHIRAEILDHKEFNIKVVGHKKSIRNSLKVSKCSERTGDGQRNILVRARVPKSVLTLKSTSIVFKEKYHEECLKKIPFQQSNWKRLRRLLLNKCYKRAPEILRTRFQFSHKQINRFNRFMKPSLNLRKMTCRSV